MLGLDIVGSIVATSTVKTVAKFLDDRIAEYIGKKFDNTPPGDYDALKKEIEKLKIELESKDNNKISPSDIVQVNNAIIKIAQKQSSSSDKIISDSIFLEWSRKEERNLEEQAHIEEKKLEMLANNAKTLKIPSNAIWRDIQPTRSIIYTNLDDWERAVRDEQTGRVNHEKVRDYQMKLQNSIFASREIFDRYYNAN